MKPIARTNDLVVKRDTGELFIEDVLNHNLIHLNPTSAYVWEKCDGSKDTGEIAAEMGNELGIPVSENVILMAVSRLQGDRLLEFA
jgi:Coenzyme PQQ synthesis protein D (PqqD)